ncbi:reverse transcriptase zinc-binding domain-containing protein [Artemisia annua]|uniref:Reverse transcriptase zinc-binding domain-containing protein n=1 Tax=Artemisia annua TaxID=35608 RepID=A0A2U1PIJ9_ARTAN|nr:reverse transcriptase zinc-binding domain-containing protein [Artemisia annua]
MNHVTHRAVSNAGYNKREKVVDVVNNGSWSWPQTWYNQFPALSQINVPNLRPDQPDSLIWKYNGGFYEFSIKHAWHAMRERGVEVDWSYLVWSTYSIPRHTTHLWLVMRKRLLTQDRMRQWHVGNETDLAFTSLPAI